MISTIINFITDIPNAVVEILKFIPNFFELAISVVNILPNPFNLITIAGVSLISLIFIVKVGRGN